jgi:hypothetical protein
MRQLDPKPLAYQQHGATGALLYLGGIGVATISMLRVGLGTAGGIEIRDLQVWKASYPVKRCKYCGRPNVPVDGDGWQENDPVKGEYCGRLCRQNYLKRQNRQRAKAKRSQEE